MGKGVYPAIYPGGVRVYPAIYPGGVYMVVYTRVVYSPVASLLPGWYSPVASLLPGWYNLVYPTYHTRVVYTLVYPTLLYHPGYTILMTVLPVPTPALARCEETRPWALRRE